MTDDTPTARAQACELWITFLLTRRMIVAPGEPEAFLDDMDARYPDEPMLAEARAIMETARSLIRGS